jgi:deazaflavin-dependent oxidoreductase (nitroreductase family)
MGFAKNVMIKIHHATGDRFMGMNLLYLTTVGAKSGQKRVSPVAWFPDGENAWLVVASNNGAARHPNWYHNVMAHPDQVSAEVAGRSTHVNVEQLEGARRDEAWQQIVASQPRFGGYQKKTDRALPVLRLSRQDSGESEAG